MQKPPIKHNPAFLADEELTGAFVVRHDDLALIVRVIRENTGDSNQHILVIGPRGIGKTMLVQRVALEVRRDEELQQKWYPLIFAEESYEVGTSGEFWLESLFHLGRQTGDPMWNCSYEDLKREPVEDRLRERALAQLMDFADKKGKRLLLIVENLNMILGDQIAEDHAWKLRHTLMHEPRVMLLATATARIDLPENTHKPMFELLKSHVLQPLNDEECQAVWRSIAGQELGPRRIRAVSILTGGNPRLLAIISHFGSSLSFAELMQDMTGLVDEHTDYFKSQLDSLPPIERKAYVALADLWDPSTAREIAAASRLGVNMTSSLLRRLASRGAVIEIPGKKRTKRYQVAERMYNIYYLMRRRGAPSERVKAVVQFMVQFYEDTELVEVARRLTEEACHLTGQERQYHYHAFEGILRTAPPELRSRILRYTRRDFLEAADQPDSLRQWFEEAGVGRRCPCDLIKHSDKRVHDLMIRGSIFAKEGHNQEAEGALREAIDIDAGYPDAWIMLGRILNKQPDRKDEAELAFRKATEAGPFDPCTWDALGRFLLKESNRHMEAEHAFRKALESYPDCSDAWLSLANLAASQTGRERDVKDAYREAEEACVRRTKKYPGHAQSWRILGQIRHHHTRHFAEAETAYRRALELDLEHVSALGNLGQLLRDHLGKYEEAEALFKKIIKLDSDKADKAWADLGQLYERLERYNEAEAAYRQTIELNPKFDWAWEHLGYVLHYPLKRYSEAEATYRKAIELDPKHSCPWVELGILLQYHLNRPIEAEAAYRNAIEINPKHALALVQLGDLIAKDSAKFKEAEQAYRTAIEIDARDERPRVKLVKLVLAGMKQPESAFELARESLVAIPDEAFLLNGLAWNFFKFGPLQYLAYAEEWARKAVALETNSAYVHTLACVLARAGKLSEALQFTRKVLEDSKFVGARIDHMVVLFAELVTANCAVEALTALRDSSSATALEPVAVALRMHTGTDVHVAPEIAEVAKDVLQRFQRRIESRKKPVQGVTLGGNGREVIN